MVASWTNFFYTGLDQLPPKYAIIFKSKTSAPVSFIIIIIFTFKHSTLIIFYLQILVGILFEAYTPTISRINLSQNYSNMLVHILVSICMYSELFLSLYLPIYEDVFPSCLL